MNEVLEKDFSKAKAYAYRLLSRRLYSQQELSEKLKTKGFTPLVKQQVIKDLISYNYLDDLQFARAWIKTRMRLKPKGEGLLKLELLKKGINKEITSQALEENSKDYDYEQTALELARQKINRLNLDLSLKTKQKIFSFLRQRGFSYQIIQKALREIFRYGYHR